MEGLKEGLLKRELWVGKSPILGNCLNMRGVNDKEEEGMAVGVRSVEVVPCWWRRGYRLFENRFCDVSRLFRSRSCSGSLSLLFLRGGREVEVGICGATLVCGDVTFPRYRDMTFKIVSAAGDCNPSERKKQILALD